MTTPSEDSSESLPQPSAQPEPAVARETFKRFELRRFTSWPGWAKIAAVLVTVSAVVGAYATYVQAVNSNPKETEVITPPTIDTTQLDVPLCADLSGTAAPRAGRVLLVSIHFGNGRHFFVEPIRNGDRWRFRGEVGSPNGQGIHFYVSVFYVEESYGNYLLKAQGRAADGESAIVLFQGLPPGSEGETTKEFVRDNNPNPQHC